MADFDRELFDALRVAFPDTGELAAFVHLSLGRNLAEIVDERGDLRAQTLGLLRDAKASGDLVRLVLAACRERPRHPRMLALLQHPDIEPFVRGLPTPGEVADLLALIEEAGVKPDPCRRALMAVVDDGASKSSARDMVWHLADFPTSAGVPKLAAFAQHLAFEPEAAPIRERLRAWIEGHVERHGCDPDAVVRRWEELEARRLGCYVVVVDLDGDPEHGYDTSAWLTRERAAVGDALPVEHLGVVKFDEVAGKIRALLESDAWRPTLEVCGRTRIELVLPIATLRSGAPRVRPLDLTHDVVVRCRERIDGKLRGGDPGLWKRKTEACFSDSRPVEWVVPTDGAACATEDWQESLLADGPVALAANVPAGALVAEHRHALVEQTLRAGVPVMAWLRSEADGVDPEPIVHDVTSRPPREALERVREGIQSSSTRSQFRQVILLWDFWGRLPPNRQRRATLRAPSKT